MNLADDSYIYKTIYFTGKEVLYTSDSPIEGLNSGSTYYAIVIDFNNIKLANSKIEAESNISIDLTIFLTEHIHYTLNTKIQLSLFLKFSTLILRSSFGCFACVEGNITVGFNGIRKYIGTPFAQDLNQVIV